MGERKYLPSIRCPGRYSLEKQPSCNSRALQRQQSVDKKPFSSPENALPFRGSASPLSALSHLRLAVLRPERWRLSQALDAGAREEKDALGCSPGPPGGGYSSGQPPTRRNGLPPIVILNGLFVRSSSSRTLLRREREQVPNPRSTGLYVVGFTRRDWRRCCCGILFLQKRNLTRETSDLGCSAGGTPFSFSSCLVTQGTSLR